MVRVFPKIILNGSSCHSNVFPQAGANSEAARESNLRLSVLFSEICALRLCHTADSLYAGYES
jgi:hypothetical protein